jgi:hypothetical protein
MSYEITITERRDVKKLVGKDWAVVGTREVARNEGFYAGSDIEPKTRVESVHGYTPEIEKTISESREVLKQTVDVLDLSAVIKAINRL